MRESSVEQVLRRMLGDVRRRAGVEFSGVGVIVASDLATLPVAPLRPDRHEFGDRSAIALLASFSVRESDLHDGFHVLDEALRLRMVSQYFSPPIGSIRPPPPTSGGARWMAALLGSCLPGVVVTGLVTPDRDPTVFRNGAEVAAAPSAT